MSVTAACERRNGLQLMPKATSYMSQTNTRVGIKAQRMVQPLLLTRAVAGMAALLGLLFTLHWSCDRLAYDATV
jgi:hypothetical protein